MYCYCHPDAETVLRCGKCDQPICVQCVVQHPVGIRCVLCAKPGRLPTFDVTSMYYARAVGAAVGICVGGITGLVLLSLLLAPLGHVGFYVRWLALVGFGYLMGSGVSLAVNHKRGRGLQWVAGVGVAAIALVPATLLGLGLNNLLGLVILGVAVYVAVSQLRA